MLRSSEDFGASFCYITGMRMGELFPISRGYLRWRIKKGCEKTGVKKIRVHDLRHSHASLLIEMGISPLVISE